jgi:hypothetical protein
MNYDIIVDIVNEKILAKYLSVILASKTERFVNIC